jgi:hypothetical protein
MEIKFTMCLPLSLPVNRKSLPNRPSKLYTFGLVNFLSQVVENTIQKKFTRGVNNGSVYQAGKLFIYRKFTIKERQVNR